VVEQGGLNHGGIIKFVWQQSQQCCCHKESRKKK